MQIITALRNRLGVMLLCCNYQHIYRLKHDKRGLDHFSDSLFDAEVFQPPNELLDAAAADAFGADVHRRGGGMQAIEIGHFVVAGDDADGLAIDAERWLWR